MTQKIIAASSSVKLSKDIIINSLTLGVFERFIPHNSSEVNNTLPNNLLHLTIIS